MKKIDGIFLNSMFECNNYACNCVKDIENVTPNKPPKNILKLNSCPNTLLHYSYSSNEGLNLTGVSGGILENNILGKLMAISNDDIDDHIKFFKKYGFLLPISNESYESINAEDLIGIVNRIKATIGLMSSLAKRNYRNILENVVFLLYSPVIEVGFSGFTFSTCRHRFSEIVETYNLFPDISRDSEVFVKGTYSVPDTIVGGKNHIDYLFYNAVCQGALTEVNGTNTPWFKHLMAAYVGCHNETEAVRKLLDFFYHFQTEVSVIKAIEYKKMVLFNPIDEEWFTENMKTHLLNVARIVIGEEINFNIKGIHPKYDGSRFSAAWQVDTLIEALYFSIFYMKAGVEIYKECENPNCKRNKYFLVEATRTNKKYCCPQCANAAAAQRHRKRNFEIQA